MRPISYGRRMIGGNQYPSFSHFFYGFHNRTDYFFIYLLYALDFFHLISIMSGLIRSFNMNKDNIVIP